MEHEDVKAKVKGILENYHPDPVEAFLIWVISDKHDLENFIDCYSKFTIANINLEELLDQ